VFDHHGADDRDAMSDLWNLQEFRAGLWFASVAALVLLIVGLAISVRAMRQPLPLGGAVIVVGALWSIADNRHLPTAVLVGVIGIGAVAGLSHALRVSRWYCVVLALPFAFVIGFHGELVSDLWARTLVTVAVAAGATLVTEFDDTWRREAMGVTLFVVTAAGVYATVPDTELVGAVLGASLPLVLLGWPCRLASLGRPGGAAATALLLWAGAAGGGGRPASIVAVVACLGLLVGVPVGMLLLPRAAATFRRRLSESPLLGSLVASHVVIVATAARVAGQQTDLVGAAVLAVVIGAAAVLIGAMFRPPSRAAAPARVD
jgi:hypothetical protein